jgi:hypothetical protein
VNGFSDWITERVPVGWNSAVSFQLKNRMNFHIILLSSFGVKIIEENRVNTVGIKSRLINSSLIDRR